MKKIVFAMIEAGGGHKSPAEAVMEAFTTLFPGEYETCLLDFMKDLGCVDLDRRHKNGWNFLLKHPSFASVGFYLENLFSSLSRRLIRNYLKPFYPYVRDYLQRVKPAVVFSTHFFNSFALGRVIRENALPTILVTFVSEIFDVHAFWIIDNVDYFIVSSASAKRLLVNDGIKEETIFVMPYPVRPSFSRIQRTRAEVFAVCGIDGATKTMLVSFGGQGVGRIDRFLDALTREKIRLNVLVITGKNQVLAEHLRQRYDGNGADVTVRALGYVENMNEYLNSCDFCFIKSGPATTMEAVLLRKPIIFYKPASGNEKTNIDFFIKRGIAFYAGKSARKFIRAVKGLTGEGGLERVKGNYGNFFYQNGSEPIARFLKKIAEGEKPGK